MSSLLARLPPGPRAPRWLQSLRLSFRPYDLLDTCARRYGDCFTLRPLARPPYVVFSDPGAIEAIFTADADDLRGGVGNAHLRPFVGARSLLVLDGARHLDERRVVMPAFHGERLRVYARTMHSITREAVDAWPRDRPFSLHGALQAITFEVILRVVFGLADEGSRDRVRRRLAPLLARAGGGWAALIPMFPALQRDLGPLSPWRLFRRQMREVDAIVREEIRARRAAATREGNDVLAMLLAARRADGSALTDDELRDELFTLLMTGHETTATSLAWLFDRLLEDHATLESVRIELGGVAGDRPIDPAALADLPHLDAVIKETARLRPIFPAVLRWVARPTRIGACELPAGVMVVACAYLTHRRSDVWRDPERFDPARFLAARPSVYAYFPFGGGARRCIGAAFAPFEMKLVVAEVLARVELRRARGGPARPVGRNVTVAPRDGVPVVVTSRA